MLKIEDCSILELNDDGDYVGYFCCSVRHAEYPDVEIIFEQGESDERDSLSGYVGLYMVVERGKVIYEETNPTTADIYQLDENTLSLRDVWEGYIENPRVVMDSAAYKECVVAAQKELEGWLVKEKKYIEEHFPE